MSEFFIKRPVFAWVIAIVVMLGGLLALRTLAVAQYPEIAPTTISVMASYPGADAQTIENSVTRVIEQGMTGLDNLQYMSATSNSTGEVEVRLTFTQDANADVAQMQVQNKLQLVTSQLPQIVQASGLSVTKSSASFLMVIGFVSTDGRLSSADLDDYVASTLNDTIKRVPGVGNTQLFGSPYAMRIWLDPTRLAHYALMPADIEASLRAQNTQVSAGQLGAQPARPGQQLNATVTARSRLQTPEQFGNVIVKSGADGAIVRLRDVARVELGAENYTYSSRYNGMPASGLGINLAADANAITVARAVKASIHALSGTLPAGVKVFYPYDTTPFVTHSIKGVVKTLLEAVVLVFIVMLVFLRSVRATLIPALAIPVVLLGTWGVLAAAGYSINTLTMFAMVLSIGLLIDDAIVVVENVERVMAEEGLSPREATRKSMKEITGALVGIATVLSAVFVPMAFFSGATGVIYRQFSVTIVTSMLLSVLVALILTPALCATLLRPREAHGGRRGLGRWFDSTFERGVAAYGTGVRGVLARGNRILIAFVVSLGVLAWLFGRLPGSFLPVEDQGIVMTAVQLPTGALRDRTARVLDEVTRYYLSEERDAVEGVMTIEGFGFSGSGQNVGLAFVRLKPFAERRAARLSAEAVAQRATAAFERITDAQVYALLPPAIEEMGTSNGFDFYLEDSNGTGRDRLAAMRDRVLAAASRSPLLSNTRPAGQEAAPQFVVDIDQEKASALGLSLHDVNTTLSVAWGGDYVNDFIDRGRVKKVYLQSVADFRMQPGDIDHWFVRNGGGEMVPFSSFVRSRWALSPTQLERYNGRAAVQIQGEAAPGVSSGAAMREVDRLVSQLPAGYRHEWTGLSWQERLSRDQATALYVMSALVVFLCLAALYESWSIPLAVMLAAPIGIAGAVLAALAFGQTNDIYFKVGLLTTIGLAAKNAILIVEFALEREAQGERAVDAAIGAAIQRLRPILMTSLAFILGVAPLVLATGAGSGAQHSIGIGVMGGMIASTAVGALVIPLFFVAVRMAFGGSPRASGHVGAGGGSGQDTPNDRKDDGGEAR
ncbi:efflux RND transporter permease subunit [Trinickia caryophylli]|uniref:Efflux pump membrane transporter n=1 Tax=Trinickia caryophylli TaxID=28094 RepID=A0A1X7E8T7_TRICW|nr:efflux RND transporter permease subunit [Trinickia caryophylli]PMS13029.1 hydrophobe/amphiphile efflux-1 family RND transporter [Trinickia caryophylli]TRX14791.1 efflux RND transporter permease subunit [Trinickia caryophylli]WQE14637.1 efflux RND transporter permease subunit [Trinickia caryophylli]SMF29485.1 multidrug efflux pump [Trinickia caryophylli]GLU31944.1 multidrug efflux RND transporter permease subunit [Trinickia caryophylli]